jgi:hypothetical protein
MVRPCGSLPVGSALLQPSPTLSNEGGGSNRLTDREPLGETGRARALPSEPPKGSWNRKAATPWRSAAFTAVLSGCQTRPHSSQGGLECSGAHGRSQPARAMQKMRCQQLHRASRTTTVFCIPHPAIDVFSTLTSVLPIEQATWWKATPAVASPSCLPAQPTELSTEKSNKSLNRHAAFMRTSRPRSP